MSEQMFEIVKVVVSTVTPVIVATIGIIVTRYLVPWLKSKMSKTDWETLEALANTAVQSAEQLWKNEPESGSDKKRYALKLLADAVNENGQRITQAQLEALVEAAVKAMNDSKAN